MTSIIESFDSRDGAWMGVGFAAGLIIGVAASFTAVRVSDNRNRARRIEEAKERMYAAKREKALAEVEIEEQEAEIEEIEAEELVEEEYDYAPTVEPEAPTPADERVERIEKRIETSVYNPIEPYVITVTQYNDPDWDHHSKCTAVYLPEDESFVEEDGSIMGDLGAVPIFPDDIDKQFGFGNNDENVVYIRNEHYMCDYEITRRPGMSIIEYGNELEGLG